MTALRNPSPLRRYLRHGMLPQLATFEAVLRLRSATRAAEAMCIAQPTLSGHLRKLGEALGVPLFKSQGKHLVPTDAALVLLQTCHEIFAALARCEVALAQRRLDLPASSANIATPPIVMITLPPTERANQAVDRQSSGAADAAGGYPGLRVRRPRPAQFIARSGGARRHRPHRLAATARSAR